MQFWFLLAGPEKKVKGTKMFTGLYPTLLFGIWVCNMQYTEDVGLTVFAF